MHSQVSNHASHFKETMYSSFHAQFISWSIRTLNQSENVLKPRITLVIPSYRATHSNFSSVSNAGILSDISRSAFLLIPQLERLNLCIQCVHGVRATLTQAITYISVHN